MSRRSVPPALLLMLSVVLAISGGACFGSSSGDGGGGNAGGALGGPTCARAESLLRGCGLLSPGLWRCREPSSAEDQCEAQCFLSVDCPTIDALLCRDLDPDQLPEGSPIQTCLDRCDGPDFVCDNGQSVPDGWRCDDEDDCGDGSDERDCGGDSSGDFACDNGSSVPRTWICDGDNDCGDQSDEQNCPTFACDDGSSIVADDRCDGNNDCPDGSDETGCAQRVCDGVAEGP